MLRNSSDDQALDLNDITIVVLEESQQLNTESRSSASLSQCRSTHFAGSNLTKENESIKSEILQILKTPNLFKSNTFLNKVRNLILKINELEKLQNVLTVLSKRKVIFCTALEAHGIEKPLTMDLLFDVLSSMEEVKFTFTGKLGQK